MNVKEEKECLRFFAATLGEKIAQLQEILAERKRKEAARKIRYERAAHCYMQWDKTTPTDETFADFERNYQIDWTTGIWHSPN